MRTVKWNAFLSGLCVTAVVLGLTAASAHADVTIERGASILAFPKVLANGSADTVIQITNLSNNMVHARCFYVNARLRNPNEPEGPFNQPIWQETDFTIWLTKQQPTHWRVSTGRQVNPLDHCFTLENSIDAEECENAGIDPGAVPPVPKDFVGELKCVEVDESETPVGGNHLKGEATVKNSDGDVAKYNGIGFEATDLAGETDNTLLLDLPKGATDGGQYSACPNRLLLNHIAEGATDPAVLALGRGGVCMLDEVTSQQANFDHVQACSSDDDCGGDYVCDGGPEVSVSGNQLSLRSATLTDLTLVPCQEDFEEQKGGVVTVKFTIYNEFETPFSASTTVACWKNFFLHQVDSRNNPENSVFSAGVLGSTAAMTVIEPVDGEGGVIGVAGVVRADRDGQIARTLHNIHIEGDRFTATDGAVVDKVILSEP